MSGDKRPTLTAPTGMGGVIAQGGFDYQLWHGLIRLPRWLKNPAFEGIIFEGLEDVEARFFSAYSPRGRLLERYQAKSGDLDAHDVRKVFDAFLSFEQAYPASARMQTLVTPRLPSSLQWLARDADRVRKARPFYAPFADVMKASDEQFRSDCLEQFGPILGAYVAESVEVTEQFVPNRDHAVQAFGLELSRAFPLLAGATPRVDAVFGVLSELGRNSIGSLLERGTLIRALEGEFGQPLTPSSSVSVHVRSDRNESNESAIEIDATAFSGGGRPFPASQRWSDELVAPLVTTAAWLTGRGSSRLSISGSYRLTTAFALGWAFRAAVGFELEIPTRDGVWATDERHDLSAPDSPWMISQPQKLHGDRLVVAVGILRRPGEDLPGDIEPAARLSAFLDGPVASARAAQAAVAVVKSEISNAVARLRPRYIDLHYAGPAAFAVVLGHRWNALPPTQLHEFIVADRRYIPTAFLA